MEERPFHPLDYVSVVRRRFRWFAIPLAACVIGGAILAMVLPSWYRAEATIGVTSAAVSPDVTKSNAASLDREERVRALTQQLFSRPLLERVAREEGLTHGRPMEQVVAELRRRTSVRADDPLARRATARPGFDTFAISYTDRSPEQTQKVTNRLAQVFVDETRRARESRAERSSEFLALQLRQSQDRLTELEERLRQKKEAYMGRLPEQRDANLQMVATLSQRLEASSNTLRGEQDRLSMIERQIDGMRQGTAEVAPIRAAIGPTTAQGRVALLQRQLADAKTIYTDKHPEVQRLQQELDEARASLSNGGNGGERDDLLRTDPTYQQLLADRNMARLRVQNLRRDEAALRAQISEYQRRVEAAPMVEQELAALTREYGLEKTQYGQLSEKHKTALVSEDLERKQGNERFSLLYPAARPDSPESPNRGRLMLMAIALGFVLGAALVFGREYLDRSIHDARALQAAFDVPVLAEIPHLGNPAQGT